MNDAHFHDIVMIWLLRRLDLGEAKREVWRAYQELCENEDILELSHDELTVYMLDILDKHELPHPIRNANNYNLLEPEPF